MARPDPTHTRARGKEGRAKIARPDDDDLPTPPAATRALLSMERFENTVICEPFAGAGILAAVVRDEIPSSTIRATTLVDYGDKFGLGIGTGVDFRRHWTPPDCRFSIISNVPYFLVDETKGEMVNEMLDTGAECVALLMNQAFEESGNRFKRVFSKRAPTRIYQFVDRVTMIPHRLWEGRDDRDWPHGGAISFAWYVWRKPFGPPPSQKYWITSQQFARHDDIERYQVDTTEASHRLRLL